MKSRSHIARVFLIMLALTACTDRTSTNPNKSAAAPSAGQAAPGPQPQPDASTTPRAQASGLPDFTVLVETQGPAVVNVVTTTRAVRSGPGGGLPDDPLFDFFRRFMPNPPDPGAGPGPEGRGPGIGAGFIISTD